MFLGNIGHWEGGPGLCLVTCFPALPEDVSFQTAHLAALKQQPQNVRNFSLLALSQPNVPCEPFFPQKANAGVCRLSSPSPGCNGSVSQATRATTNLQHPIRGRPAFHPCCSPIPRWLTSTEYTPVQNGADLSRILSLCVMPSLTRQLICKLWSHPTIPRCLVAPKRPCLACSALLPTIIDINASTTICCSARMARRSTIENRNRHMPAYTEYPCTLLYHVGAGKSAQVSISLTCQRASALQISHEPASPYRLSAVRPAVSTKIQSTPFDSLTKRNSNC